jgi:LuxR family maltose regulon positive regulatory protein
MAWFEAGVPLGKHPEIAATGALIHALEGDGLGTDYWLSEATQVGVAGAEMPPVGILVQALGTRDGVETMIADARSAREAMDPGSFWVPASFLVEGLGQTWNQDLLAADSLLAEAAGLGEEAGAMLTNTLALAERGWIAMTSGDWDNAQNLVLQSLQIIEENDLEPYSTSGLAFALGARIARHNNDFANAGKLLAKGSLARPHLGTSIPGLAVQTLVEMAKTRLELADAVGARVLVRDARDIVGQRPQLGSLPLQLDELDLTLLSFGSGVVGPSALTKAELRLLPLLASHLTFPEIGDRLFISRHTVKSQAMSIYRKLGTSSRSEAVARAVESGLLRD